MSRKKPRHGRLPQSSVPASMQPEQPPAPQAQATQGKKRRRAMPQPEPVSRSERQRRKVRRSRRRRMTRRLSFAILTLLAAFLAVTVFFRADKLQVTGTEHYTAEEILQTAGVKKGDNLFSFRISTLQKKLLRNYPYLSRVEITRELPDGLTIHAVDAVPVMAIDVQGGGCFLADAQGKLLEQAASAPEGVATVTGVAIEQGEIGKYLTEKDSAHADILLRLTRALEQEGMMEQVDFINVSAAYDVRFGYLGRLDVRLGEAADLAEKLRMLSKIVADELSPSDVNVIYLKDPQTAYCPPTTQEQIEQSALPLDDIIPVDDAGGKTP